MVAQSCGAQKHIPLELIVLLFRIGVHNFQLLDLSRRRRVQRLQRYYLSLESLVQRSNLDFHDDRRQCRINFILYPFSTVQT